MSTDTIIGQDGTVIKGIDYSGGIAPLIGDGGTTLIRIFGKQVGEI